MHARDLMKVMVFGRSDIKNAQRHCNVHSADSIRVKFQNPIQSPNTWVTRGILQFNTRRTFSSMRENAVNDCAYLRNLILLLFCTMHTTNLKNKVSHYKNIAIHIRPAQHAARESLLNFRKCCKSPTSDNCLSRISSKLQQNEIDFCGPR